MFLAIAITICVLELLATYTVNANATSASIFWQMEMAMIVLLGLFSNDTQRDKSVLAVMAVWFSWVVLTDLWPGYIAAPIAGIETSIFAFFVLWALVRPYFYPSFPMESRGENILVGFYRGTKAPLLSSLSALVGLPFSSIIIVGGVTALRPSAFGKMTINRAESLNPEDYVFINTGIKGTPKIFEEIAKCSGKSTRLLGLFSTKCVRNCQPILELLGLKPKSWFHFVPSVYYYQVARGS